MENSVQTAKHWGFYCLDSVQTGAAKQGLDMPNSIPPFICNCLDCLDAFCPDSVQTALFPCLDTHHPLGCVSRQDSAACQGRKLGIL